METAFTPLQSLAGGALIGAAAVLLMLVAGRIMGATGVLAGAIWGPDDRSWRIALIAGMLTGPLAYLGLTGGFPAIQVPVSTWMMIVGGFLVGVGVTFGGGCTSGHGVCGMARLSPRSIVATVTFMIATGITVYLVRHVFGG
ncbi:MAG: YeeE/YedE thiosulfate transporter family protein [Paracoccaceae bacterium]|nr:YeeE/YedE thiosulfate transporter family protein [Paracoccaceae bacterium]